MEKQPNEADGQIGIRTDKRHASQGQKHGCAETKLSSVCNREALRRDQELADKRFLSHVELLSEVCPFTKQHSQRSINNQSDESEHARRKTSLQATRS